VADAFVAARPDRRVVTGLTDVLLVLGELVPPPAVPGGPRLAVAEELDLLVAWHEQFARDAGLPVRATRESVGARLAQTGLWWWTVDDERVALAGHAPLVESPGGPVGRIGPVFTPAAFRRRGYGTAVTAVVVEHLLPLCATVMLYADAANATSNGVYERLGFRRTAEVVELDLVPTA
jgi:predicted GNAT family acetyltransferase